MPTGSPCPAVQCPSCFLSSLRCSSLLVTLLSWSGGRSRLGNLPAVVLEGDAVEVRSAAHAGVERVDRGDLLTIELEVEDVEVLGDAAGFGRLRDRGASLLQVPAQHHLGGRLAMLARD